MQRSARFQDFIILFSAIVAISLLLSPFAEASNINSVDFESSNIQYLSIGDTSQSGLDGTLDMTVEAWVKFESLPPFDHNAAFVVKSVSAGDDRSYTFYYSGTDFKLRWVNQSDGYNGTDVGVDWVPSLGVWYHVVAKKSGSSITFYVNGSQLGSVQSGTGTINNSTAPFRIGAHGNGEAYMDGKIDDVRVWNVARTQEEIAANMNRELVGNEPGLVGYWKMNGSFEDSTANANHLTSVNGPQFSDDVPFLDEEEGVDPVIVIPGILGSAQKNGVWQIDPILHTYDDLVSTLEANGYTSGADLFTFAYDWRASNVTTAALLKQKIDEVKALCSCEKVDLVAHSMGGLVARQYVQSGEYDNDVDQLIFLGTPHRGAPKAYLMWEGGEFVSPSLLDGLTKRFLKGEARKNGFASTFAYLRNHPITAVEQLLPDYSYLFDGSTLRSYPTLYPRNTFLENLNAAVGGLLSPGIELHAFVSANKDTITGIQVVNAPNKAPLWEHGYPRNFDGSGDRGLVLGVGDATVPTSSATFVSATTTTLTSSHSALPEDASGNIVTLLNGTATPIIIDNWNLPDMKMLLFQLFSPADILVTDPLGRRAGFDSGTELAEIPGAFYAGPTALVEYLTIPNPMQGTYTVRVKGTGSGTYELLSSYMEEGSSDDLSRYGTATPGSNADYQIQLGADDVLSPTVTFESMLADLAFAYKQGWISRAAETSISTKLSVAKSLKNQRAKTIALENIKREIERRHGNGINDEAYALLMEDIEALLR